MIFISKDDEVSKKKTEEYFDMAEERITWEQDNQMILVEKENAKQAWGRWVDNEDILVQKSSIWNGKFRA